MNVSSIKFSIALFFTAAAGALLILIALFYIPAAFAQGTCPNPELAADQTPSGYKWEAQCDRSCTDTTNDSDCKLNASDTNTYWCYGFVGGAKCMKLVQSSTTAPAPTATPKPASGCPTTSPYNGVSCTVHPPGSQCAADYQWCDGGCCKYSGFACETLGSKRADVCGGQLEVYNNCTGKCVDGKKYYFCTDTRNKNCTNEPDGVWCSPEDSQCATSLTPTPTPSTGGGPPEGSVCSYDILDTSGRSVKSGPGLYEGENYTFRITMLNTVKEGKAEDWLKGTHTLQALNNTTTIWGIPQTYQLPKDRVSQGTSVVFEDIDFVASPLPEGEKDFDDRPIYFQMVGPSGPFGSACEPQLIRVLRRTELTYTKCFVISEKPTEVNEVTNCDYNLYPQAKPYPQHPATINFQLSEPPGEKTIYVKFLDNNDRPSNNGVPYTKKVIYSPDPKITDVDCSYDPTPSASGTAYLIRGVGFGSQTIGSKVRVGGQEAIIVGWKADAIVARIEQRAEGNAPVQVILEDGRKADGACTVGTTTAALSLRGQCISSGKFETSDVDVAVYSSGPEPFFRQKTRTDKDGNVQGFSPKLEKGKVYTVLVETPGSLVRSVVFSTSSSTSVVGPVVMPLGNIAPSPVADTVINSFDVNALYSQWSLVKDVTRPGDLSKDLRVNSIDYSCMLLNFNKRDEIFTPPTITPPAAPTATSAPQPSPSPSPSPTSIVSPSPTEIPSPTPSIPPDSGDSGGE